jgi:hypothetical protein
VSFNAVVKFFSLSKFFKDTGNSTAAKQNISFDESSRVAKFVCWPVTQTSKKCIYEIVCLVSPGFDDSEIKKLWIKQFGSS